MSDTKAAEAKYRCISDRYDFNPENIYTLEEFQAMCLESFGSACLLTWDGTPDQYRDETGVVVLEVLGKDPETVLAEIAKLTANGEHTRSVLVLASFLGDAAAAEQLETWLVAAGNRAGYATWDVVFARAEVRTALLVEVGERYPELAARFLGAF